MLKNAELRQKYPFIRKGLNYFEAEWITWGCICTVRKEEWKDYCDFVDIEYQILISLSVTRWRLSLYCSLPRIFQLHPASNSYFMSIDKPTVVLKRFFGNSLSEFCSHLRHLQSWVCFYWASSEYWEVISFSCWGCIVFRHCEGKDSRETVRCIYQATSNQQ